MAKAGIVDFSALEAVEADEPPAAAVGSDSSKAAAAAAGGTAVAVAVATTEVKQTLDAIDWCIYKRVMSRDRAGYDGYEERRHHPFDPSNKRTEGKVVCTDTGECMWVLLRVRLRLVLSHFSLIPLVLLLTESLTHSHSSFSSTTRLFPTLAPLLVCCCNTLPGG